MRFATLRTYGYALTGAALLAACSDQPVTAPGGGPALELSALAAAPTLVINEVMPNPSAVADGAGEWFEVYNASATPIDLQGWQMVSNNDAPHTVAASVVVPAGGYAVLGRNADSTTNGGVRIDYSYNTGASTPNLANGTTDWLALRDASGASVDSVAWGTASPPNGAARMLIDPLTENTVMSGAAWATSTSTYGLGDKGTPGRMNDGASPPPPPPPPGGTGAVMISEYIADPNAVPDAAGEWFEVYNLGTTPVDLQGWQIVSRGDATHTINASAVVPAQGYLVLGRNADSTANGGVRVGYVYAEAATLNLANSSDHLVLKDGEGATADSIAWSSTQPRGAARAVVDLAADNSNAGGSNWATATAFYGAGDRGTPGRANGSGGGGGGQPGVVATVSLSINTPRQIPVGYTKPAFATARDGMNTVVTPAPKYAWSSSNPAVATVDSLGYVDGMAQGTATITATAPNGVSGSATITILPADAPTTAVYRSHVEFGAPEADGVLQSKPQFSASYSSVRGGPNWVSWNLNSTHFGAAARCDCFSADRTLPSGTYRVVDYDYRNGGYDRGHMVQSESRTATDQENASTFLLTNILPQAGENNQGPWNKFENYLNDLARQEGKEIYVVAGGEYSASPATVKGEGKVQIPEWTWKVAVIMDGGEGLGDVRGYQDVQVLAIRMPNDTAGARGMRNNPWQMYAVTVDEIESRTGYDLLDRLPGTVERIVEANDRAPVAATDGPYIGLEGAAVTLDASSSTDPDGDVLEYEWTFGDGSTGTGARPTHVYADNGTYAVRVIATDPYGAADTASTVVTVMNVAPTVNAFAGAALLRGETYAAAGAFADAGADQWTATVDYGDGSGEQPLALNGGSFSLSHRYTAAGGFTVTVTVTDDDGATGTRTATVAVQSAAQAVSGLGADVDALGLSRGETQSLAAKLRAAAASLARGQNHTAVNQLGAFVNHVRAMVSGGSLSAAQGQALTAAAERIVRSIES